MQTMDARGASRKARKRQKIVVTIIESFVDDVSEQVFEFSNGVEAFQTICKTIKMWGFSPWPLPLPPAPNYEKFLKAVELQTSVYDVGSLDGCGFHLEIQIKS